MVNFPIAPTFQQMRQEALRLLGDALDVLRSDWDEDHGPIGMVSLTALQRVAVTRRRMRCCWRWLMIGWLSSWCAATTLRRRREAH